MKENIIYLYSLNYPFFNDVDPLHKLLTEYKDIEKIKEISQKINNDKKKDFTQFLYSNKNIIHEILYKEDKIIPINSKEKINFSELFYLSLLISDDEDIINYTFSIEYIRNINNIFKRNEEIDGLKKIIISKIILTLIHNFKGELQYYRNKDEFEEEINELEKENKERIKNNIHIFVDLNLQYTDNDIYSKKIDCIYLEIIIALIKRFNEKFNNNYGFLKDMIESLELDKDDINITQTIFEGLSKEINEENEYIKQYEIKGKLNEKKIKEIIYFYYFIIKYIFKDSLYIYQINFLYKNIKKILYFAKKDGIEIPYEERLDFIKLIEKMKYSIDGNQNVSDKSILNSYSSSISKTIKDAYEENDNGRKLNDDNTLNNSLNKTNDQNNVLHHKKIKYDKAKKILERVEITIKIIPIENGEIYKSDIEYEKILYGKYLKEELKNRKNALKINENYDIITEEDKKNNKDSELVYKNYKRFAIFIEEIEEYIKKSKIKFNPQITLELENTKKPQDEKTPDEYKILYNITCISTFINQLNNNEIMKFKDENILVNSINGKCKGFIYLINELMSEDYNGQIFNYIENNS